MLTAQVSFKQVVDARTASTASGKRDEITLLATAALALVHQIAGEFEVAKDLYSDVLAGWQILGDLNNDGAISAKSELANTLAEMGDCEQAQVLFEEALHAYEMSDGFGEMHEATLGVMQNMAMNLCSLSRDEEAETIYIRALVSQGSIRTIVRWLVVPAGKACVTHCYCCSASSSGVSSSSPSYSTFFFFFFVFFFSSSFYSSSLSFSIRCLLK